MKKAYLGFSEVEVGNLSFSALAAAAPAAVETASSSSREAKERKAGKCVVGREGGEGVTRPCKVELRT